MTTQRTVLAHENGDITFRSKHLPGTLYTCDFCSLENIALETGTFWYAWGEIPAPGWVRSIIAVPESHAVWLACQVCTELIFAQDAAELVRRRLERVAGESEQERLGAFYIHTLFWQTTPWFVPIDARARA